MIEKLINSNFWKKHKKKLGFAALLTSFTVSTQLTNLENLIHSGKDFLGPKPASALTATKLTWDPGNPVVNMDKYGVYRWAGNDQIWRLKAFVPQAPSDCFPANNEWGMSCSYVDSTIQPGIIYQFKVKGWDKGGHITDFSKVVSMALSYTNPLDTSAPTLTINNPGITNQNQFRLSFTTFDESSYSISLNGKDININLIGTNNIEESVDLEEGENIFNVKVTDELGLYTSKSATVILDSKKPTPELNVISDSTQNIYALGVDTSWIDSSKIKFAKIEFNSKIMFQGNDLESTGNKYIKIPLKEILNGKNVIRYTLEDLAGNKTTLEKTLNIKIAWQRIIDGFEYNNDTELNSVWANAYGNTVNTLSVTKDSVEGNSALELFVNGLIEPGKKVGIERNFSPGKYLNLNESLETIISVNNSLPGTNAIVAYFKTEAGSWYKSKLMYLTKGPGWQKLKIPHDSLIKESGSSSDTYKIKLMRIVNFNKGNKTINPAIGQNSIIIDGIVSYTPLKTIYDLINEGENLDNLKVANLAINPALPPTITEDSIDGKFALNLPFNEIPTGKGAKWDYDFPIRFNIFDYEKLEIKLYNSRLDNELSLVFHGSSSPSDWSRFPKQFLKQGEQIITFLTSDIVNDAGLADNYNLNLGRITLLNSKGEPITVNPGLDDYVNISKASFIMEGATVYEIIKDSSTVPFWKNQDSTRGYDAVATTNSLNGNGAVQFGIKSIKKNKRIAYRISFPATPIDTNLFTHAEFDLFNETPAGTKLTQYYKDILGNWSKYADLVLKGGWQHFSLSNDTLKRNVENIKDSIQFALYNRSGSTIESGSNDNYFFNIANFNLFKKDLSDTLYVITKETDKNL